MKNTASRIGMWASAGFLVSVAWGFYFASANKSIPIEPTVNALARLTQPTAAVMLYLNPAARIALDWLIAANAATYVLLGLIVEMIRQRYRLLQTSN